MNDTPAEILAAYMVGKTWFKTPGTAGAAMPLFVSAMPDDEIGMVPDEAAAVYDTTGMIRARLLAGGFTVQTYGIQLKARALSYKTAFTTLSNVADAIEADLSKPTVSVGGNTYRIDGCRRASGVISMGQDQKRRALCSVNFLLDLVGH